MLITAVVITVIINIIMFVPCSLPKGMCLSFDSSGETLAITYSVHFGRFLTVSTGEGIYLPGNPNITYTARTTYLRLRERKQLMERMKPFLEIEKSSDGGMVAGGIQVRFSTNKNSHFSGNVVLLPQSEKGYVSESPVNDMLAEVMLELMKCAKPFPVHRNWKELYKQVGTKWRLYIYHPEAYFISLLK